MNFPTFSREKTLRTLSKSGKKRRLASPDLESFLSLLGAGIIPRELQKLVRWKDVVVDDLYAGVVEVEPKLAIVRVEELYAELERRLRC